MVSTTLCRTGDVCAVRKGTTITEKEATFGEVPVVAGGMKPSYFHDESNRLPGVVTISASGANAGFVSYWDCPIWASDCTTVESKNPALVSSRYVFHYLKSIEATVISSFRRGAAQPHVYARDLQEIIIPLPPIEEQQRIVAALDAADALRTKRRQTQAKLNTLIQAIFTDMFGGGDGPAVSPNGIPEGHPKGWVWRPIGELAELATGHTPDRKVADYWDGEISWINLNEIREFDGRTCFETAVKITRSGVRHSSAVVLPLGTVCFSRTASIGFVTLMGVPMTTSQDFVNWICGDDLNPTYLMHALMMSRDVLRSSSSGSTHKTIYVRDAKRFSILYPPRALQDKFEQIVAKAGESADRMSTELQQIDVLFNSLQQRAFRGEL
jgi:type I restriction enzyme S subunit